jgi:hypothetical protein
MVTYKHFLVAPKALTGAVISTIDPTESAYTYIH